MVGWLVWVMFGALVGLYMVLMGVGVCVFVFEAGDSDGWMSFVVWVWGFK